MDKEIPQSLFYSQNQPDETKNNWDLLKERMEEFLDHEEIREWVLPIKLISSNDSKISLQVPNLIFHDHFSEKYFPILEQCKDHLGLNEIKFDFQVANATPVTPVQHSKTERPYAYQTGQPNRPQRSLLEKKYTFDTFVRGPSNEFTLATCQSVAENPGTSYNPLFIYGHTGLGKTHLMHAVGNHVQQMTPGARVVYIRSETFMNEMIHCMRHSKMWEFRQKYRHCDVFLVDDIQFISGKKATQAEFFHTFNSLHESGKQIVITSDQFPQEIPDIEERLRNRFQWGLIADIQAPDIEHRIAILMTKAEQLGILLQPDVAEYIATQFRKNIRELEGALKRLHAYATLHGRRIDLQLAMDTFKDVISDTGPRVTIDSIQKLVANHFKLKVSDLKSKARTRTILIPRQVAIFLSRSHTRASFPEIGAKFGGRDHSTVINSVKKVTEMREKDVEFRTQLDSLERKITQIC